MTAVKISGTAHHHVFSRTYEIDATGAAGEMEGTLVKCLDNYLEESKTLHGDIDYDDISISIVRKRGRDRPQQTVR